MSVPKSSLNILVVFLACILILPLISGTVLAAEPTVSNPEPPNDATGVERQPNLNVTVDDDDGDTLNVTFYNGTGGMISEHTGVSNGTTLTSDPYFGADQYDTTYEWYVEVDDGTNVTTSDTWNFTTPKMKVHGVDVTPVGPNNDMQFYGGNLSYDELQTVRYNVSVSHPTFNESMVAAKNQNIAEVSMALLYNMENVSQAKYFSSPGASGDPEKIYLDYDTWYKTGVSGTLNNQDPYGEISEEYFEVTSPQSEEEEYMGNYSEQIDINPENIEVAVYNITGPRYSEDQNAFHNPLSIENVSDIQDWDKIQNFTTDDITLYAGEDYKVHERNKDYTYLGWKGHSKVLVFRNTTTDKYGLMTFSYDGSPGNLKWSGVVSNVSNMTKKHDGRTNMGYPSFESFNPHDWLHMQSFGTFGIDETGGYVAVNDTHGYVWKEFEMPKMFPAGSGGELAFTLKDMNDNTYPTEFYDWGAENSVNFQMIDYYSPDSMDFSGSPGDTPVHTGIRFDIDTNCHPSSDNCDLMMNFSADDYLHEDGHTLPFNELEWNIQELVSPWNDEVIQETGWYYVNEKDDWLEPNYYGEDYNTYDTMTTPQRFNAQSSYHGSDSDTPSGEYTTDISLEFSPDKYSSFGSSISLTPSYHSTNITNCSQLQAMKYNVSSDYQLMNDIDCSNTSEWNYNETRDVYQGFEPIGPDGDEFTGSFDGNGHTISNLYMNWEGGFENSKDDIGLFSEVDGTVIENVNLENINYTTKSNLNVGGILGTGGTSGLDVVRNVNVSGVVWNRGDSPRLGGIVGQGMSTKVDDCHTNISVYVESLADSTMGMNVGGLVGSGFSHPVGHSVHQSSAVGNLEVYGPNATVGGLVGANSDYSSGLEINESYSDVEISGDVYSNVSGNGIGGLVGNMETGDINLHDNYAKGTIDITADSQTPVGGIAGTYNETESGCSWNDNNYFAGDINETKASVYGGVAGICEGDANSSFFDSDVTGFTTTACGQAKTTSEMQTESTFTDAGWDFSNVWAMEDYPVFLWEGPSPSEIFTLDSVVTNSPIKPELGDNLVINYTVVNDEGSGAQNVTFDFDGVEEDREEVDLNAGESYDGQFIYNPDEDEVGTYDVTVSTDDDSTQKTAEFKEALPPNFTIDSYSSNSPIHPAEDEIVTVDYTVSNDGDYSDVQNITFVFDGSQVDCHELNLTPGEVSSGTFNYDPPNDKTGDFTYSLQTENDTVSDSYTLDALEENDLTVSMYGKEHYIDSEGWLQHEDMGQVNVTINETTYPMNNGTMTIENVTEGQTVDLSQSAEGNWTFVEWEGQSNSFEMPDSSVDVNATYKKYFGVHISSEPGDFEGNFYINGDNYDLTDMADEAEFLPETELNITADPEPKWRLKEMSSDMFSSTNNTTVITTMPSDDSNIDVDWEKAFKVDTLSPSISETEDYAILNAYLAESGDSADVYFYWKESGDENYNEQLVDENLTTEQGFEYNLTNLNQTDYDYYAYANGTRDGEVVTDEGDVETFTINESDYVDVTAVVDGEGMGWVNLSYNDTSHNVTDSKTIEVLKGEDVFMEAHPYDGYVVDGDDSTTYQPHEDVTHTFTFDEPFVVSDSLVSDSVSNDSAVVNGEVSDMLVDSVNTSVFYREVNGSWDEVETGTVDSSDTSKNFYGELTGLSSDTMYEYYVRAEDDDSVKETSVSNFTTLGVYDVNVTASPSSYGSVVISWDERVWNDTSKSVEYTDHHSSTVGSTDMFTIREGVADSSYDDITVEAIAHDGYKWTDWEITNAEADLQSKRDFELNDTTNVTAYFAEETDSSGDSTEYPSGDDEEEDGGGGDGSGDSIGRVSTLGVDNLHDGDRDVVLNGEINEINISEGDAIFYVTTPDNTELMRLAGTYSSPSSFDREVDLSDTENGTFEYQACLVDDYSDIENITCGSVKEFAIDEPAPYYEVSITGTNGPIEEGQPLEVEYLVDNIGDDSGSQNITLALGTSDNIVEIHEDVNLVDGDASTGTFTYRATNQNGTYDIWVSSDNDVAADNITVEEPEEPDEIETLEPEYTTTNSSVLRGNLTHYPNSYVNISFYWRETGSLFWMPQDVEQYNGSTPHSFNYTLNNLDSNTTYEYMAVGEDNSSNWWQGSRIEFTTDPASEENVTPGEPYFDVMIEGTNSPIYEGGMVEVDYTVENIGDSSGTTTVEFGFDNETNIVDSKEVTLDADGTYTGTLTYNSTESSGIYPLYLITEDVTDSTNFYIEEDSSATSTSGPSGEGDMREVDFTSTSGGTVDTPGEGSFEYGDGEMIDLVAEAEPGYVFTGWEGDVEGIADVDEESTELTVDGDYEIKATFEFEGTSFTVFPTEGEPATELTWAFWIGVIMLLVLGLAVLWFRF